MRSRADRDICNHCGRGAQRNDPPERDMYEGVGCFAILLGICAVILTLSKVGCV